jgi:hypothetical protein
MSLKEGDSVTAVVKATEVTIAKPWGALSSRAAAHFSTDMPKECMKTSRFGLCFGFC